MRQHNIRYEVIEVIDRLDSPSILPGTGQRRERPFPETEHTAIQRVLVQQRRRKTAHIGDMQRTPDPGIEHAEDVSERWRTLPGVSRMRYHSHPLSRLDPPHTWIGAFAFLGHTRQM
ncbi:MAG TPA: hypothetical protein VED37_09595 [Ktedonobacteraceae bacterium]|nr:hypothetical protein [Ktedonobacteraceae bacterium]